MTIVGSVDTNVLVRHLVKDDERQSAIVAKVFEGICQRAECLLVPISVMLEFEWVLRSRYRFPKAEVIRAMSALLETWELVFESEWALEQALAHYEEGGADFAEYLHLALARKQQALPFLTFDVKASKASGARLLA